MNRTEFDRLISLNQVPSVLLFEGEEQHLREDALARLRAALLPQGLEELNETRLEAPETDELIAAAETIPFMADRRLVIIRDHPALIGRAEADGRLAEYLPKVPASTVLLFDCVQKPDGRKKLYGIIRKLGGVVTFARMTDRELTGFVTHAFYQQGKSCDERTADFLIFTCGSDTARLLSEVAKIASLRPGDAVRPEDIRALATPSSESTVFEMVDAVTTGQKTRAFALLRSRLLAGDDRVSLLAMLLRQYRLLQHVKIMKYEKRPDAEIRAALGLPDYPARQLMAQAANCTGGQVKKGVRICLDTDFAIKTGKLNPEGAVEAVMLKLLELRK